MERAVLAVVCDLLSREMGLDPDSVGERTVAVAVKERMRQCGLENELEYLDLVSTDARETTELVETVVVPETWFFRDVGPFDLLADLARERRPSPARPLRVLSAPCSTGEEPYSAAMTLLHAGCSPDDFHITAADISAKVLDTARRGVYPSSSFRTVGVDDPRAALEPRGDAWAVSSPVRRSVAFVRANMMGGGFLRETGPFDVIFCKNLAIYLNESARRRLIANVRRLLAREGIVFTGHTETMLFQRAGFTPVRFQRAFACRAASDPVPRSGPIPRLDAAVNPPNRPLATTRPDPASPPAPPMPRRPEPGAVGTNGLRAARRAADRGRLEHADALCRAHLKEHPAEPEAYFLMGLVAQARGRLDLAERLYKKTLYLDPAHYTALISLSLLCEGRGESERAGIYRRRAERAGAP